MQTETPSSSDSSSASRSGTASLTSSPSLSRSATQVRESWHSNGDAWPAAKFPPTSAAQSLFVKTLVADALGQLVSNEVFVRVCTQHDIAHSLPVNVCLREPGAYPHAQSGERQASAFSS